MSTVNAMDSVDLTPDERYLRQAFQDGAAIKRDVPMDVLGTPDVNLQARVQHLNSTHVERLRESLREIGSLKPIVVFRQHYGPGLLLADGFHRHEAYRLENYESIPCYVVEGEFREALKFATMCNRENCLGRTKEDEKKAVFMLQSDEEWRNKSSSYIADHVGICRKTCKAWRLEYCQENNVQPPDEIVYSDGRVRPSTIKRAPSRKRLVLGDIRPVKTRLDTFCGMAIPLDNSPWSGLGSALKAKDTIVVVGNITTRASLREPIARAILNRVKHCPNGRAVVVCYNPPECAALEIARRLGIEFLTPEELGESLK